MPTLDALSLELYRKELTNKQCRRVVKADAISALVEQLQRLMEEHGRSGIAAPQVGAFLQLAIVSLPQSGPHVLVNPVIVNLAGKDLLEMESCLSFPPVETAKARVWRSEIVHVQSGTIEHPDADQITIFRGMAARIVQHEIDHLNGVFFVDRCQPVGRGIVLRAYEKFLLKGATQ